MDSTILIKNVWLDGEEKCVIVRNNHIFKIVASQDVSDIKDNTIYINKGQENYKADTVINGKNKAILPGFYNLHCHAGMNILRGYSEDLPLFDWLQKIWKRESELSAEDIYNGTRLAILEMIKSGTVFFSDMYWHHKTVIRAVEEMGIRCDVGVCFMDRLSRKETEENFDFIKEFSKEKKSRISVSPAPHAIYTCSKELYRQCFELAKATDTYLQTHLAETIQEVEDCKKANNGLTPVEYLDKTGVLYERTIAAHCVHLNEKDATIFAERKSVAVHNPCSNMKLSSGVFPMLLMKSKNCNIALGTDGCSSNNNLSMIEEMKFACLLAKVAFKRADALSAKEIYKMATINGAKAYNINAGEIEEGKLADFILVDLDNERLQPLHNIIYNMVYSADSSCVDTVVCDGKILMQDHKVENEEEIIEKARRYAKA